MLADYIAKAVENANYEKMENGRFFAAIPGFEGLWAEGQTIEAARRELIETLEDWILIAFRRGYPPRLGGTISWRTSSAHGQGISSSSNS